MKHRFRSLTALFALVSLSAFVAEGAWALACSPGMAVCEAGMETCAAASSADPGAHAPAALPAIIPTAQPEVVQQNFILPAFDRTPTR